MPYRSYAEFARTKGAKDKGQRKSRAGLIAGGVAGAGYGGSLAYRTREGRPSRIAGLLAPSKGGTGLADWEKNASIRAGSVADAIKSAAGDGRLSTLRNKGRFERMGDVAKGDLAKVKQALGRSTSYSKYLGKTLGGNIARGGGLLAAAGGTAAVLSYLKNRKKKDTSLRGRATSALNRLRGK